MYVAAAPSPTNRRGLHYPQPTYTSRGGFTDPSFI
jgi:hypothetical protein